MIMIDIDIPDNCDECRFNTEYGFCKAMPDNFCGNTDNRKRPEWCPLKEQDAVEPKIMESYRTNSGRMSRRKAWCGACGIGIKMDAKFCAHCGRAVKWNA